MVNGGGLGVALWSIVAIDDIVLFSRSEMGDVTS